MYKPSQNEYRIRKATWGAHEFSDAIGMGLSYDGFIELEMVGNPEFPAPICPKQLCITTIAFDGKEYEHKYDRMIPIGIQQAKRACQHLMTYTVRFAWIADTIVKRCVAGVND